MKKLITICLLILSLKGFGQAKELQLSGQYNNLAFAIPACGAFLGSAFFIDNPNQTQIAMGYSIMGFSAIAGITFKIMANNQMILAGKKLEEKGLTLKSSGNNLTLAYRF